MTKRGGAAGGELEGVHIAHQIITKQHGGSIKVQSELGQGSTFTIQIPMKVAR